MRKVGAQGPMSNYELISFPGPEQLASAVAHTWMQALNKLGSQHPPYCVALSGGRIARQLFTASAGLAKAQGLSLDTAEFFWGDERCVPPGDPESNFHLARELLLAPLGIAESRIHRIRGEEEPEFAASEAEAELCRIASLDDDGQPVLDLIFLGMGEDGHVASLFPGEPKEARASKAVYRPVIAPKPPPRRITLGFKVIATAREVLVLASGAGKAAAFLESLAVEGKTPLAEVLRLRKSTKIYTDIRT